MEEVKTGFSKQKGIKKNKYKTVNPTILLSALISAFLFLNLNESIAQDNQPIELKKVKKSGLITMQDQYSNYPEQRPTTGKKWVFTYGNSDDLKEVEPYGKLLKPYLEGNDNAMKYFSSFRSQTIIGQGGAGLFLVGGLYLGLKAAKNNANSDTVTAGVSMMGAGLALYFILNATADGSLKKAVNAYNEGLGMVEPLEKKEGITWMIKTSSTFYGVAIVGQF